MEKFHDSHIKEELTHGKAIIGSLFDFLLVTRLSCKGNNQNLYIRRASCKENNTFLYTSTCTPSYKEQDSYNTIPTKTGIKREERFKVIKT